MAERTVALGSDHAAFTLKTAIRNHLESLGVSVTDCGTDSTESSDYPDFAAKVASLVSEGKVPTGILVCGTGIGMSIAANKFPGVRAAAVTSPFAAKAARNHNDANILCLGSRLTETAEALKLVDIFLSESFEGGRHARRVEKIKQLENKKC